MQSSIQWTLRASYQHGTFALTLATVTAVLRNLARTLKNRRDAALLAGMDDRMLSDIGLSRSDLRDAYAEPLWRDPTEILAARAHERRIHRTRTAIAAIASPPLVPSNGFAQPRTDRPARYAL